MCYYNGLDPNLHGFDSSIETENALDAFQFDRSSEWLWPTQPLYYANPVANYDWSQSPNESISSYDDCSSFDSSLWISGSDAYDGITACNRYRVAEGYVNPLEFAEKPWNIASERTSRQRPLCCYPACTSNPFRTTYDLAVHMKDHIHELLRQWADGEGQQCTWPDCSSKAKFKSRKALQTHLENIHVDPLLCPEKGCKHGTPFRSNYDLKRHLRTAHSGEKDLQYQCPFPECGKFPKTFVRKDKWLNHLKSGHDNSTCPLNHCEVGTAGAPSKLVEHIKNTHGNFECGIGSCSGKPASRFAKFELLKHLEFHHGIQHTDIYTAQNAAVQAQDRTVKSADLPKSTKWDDCKLCVGARDFMHSE